MILHKYKTEFNEIFESKSFNLAHQKLISTMNQYEKSFKKQRQTNCSQNELNNIHLIVFSRIKSSLLKSLNVF